MNRTIRVAGFAPVEDRLDESLRVERARAPGGFTRSQEEALARVNEWAEGLDVRESPGLAHVRQVKLLRMQVAEAREHGRADDAAALEEELAQMKAAAGSR